MCSWRWISIPRPSGHGHASINLDPRRHNYMPQIPNCRTIYVITASLNDFSTQAGAIRPTIVYAVLTISKPSKCAATPKLLLKPPGPASAYMGCSAPNFPSHRINKEKKKDGHENNNAEATSARDGIINAYTTPPHGRENPAPQRNQVPLLQVTLPPFRWAEAEAPLLSALPIQRAGPVDFDTGRSEASKPGAVVVAIAFRSPDSLPRPSELQLLLVLLEKHRQARSGSRSTACTGATATTSASARQPATQLSSSGECFMSWMPRPLPRGSHHHIIKGNRSLTVVFIVF